MNSLYLDMDGVVADFDGYTHQKLGIGPSEGKYPQNVWEILIENPRLYRDLKPTPYATQLYDFCHKIAKKLDYRVAFLTAIPKKNDVQYAMHDKVEWAQKHFPGRTQGKTYHSISCHREYLKLTIPLQMGSQNPSLGGHKTSEK